jgi:hypothetical protein
VAHTLAFPEWLGNRLHEEEGVGSRASNHLPASPTPHRPALLLKNLRNTNVDHAEYTEGRWSRPVAIA